MPESIFQIDLQVRDYECDMEGIVNNAVYQNYLEHARHEFLKNMGLDFARLTRGGINLVVIRAELDYRFSLRSGDRFRVSLHLKRLSPLRFVFVQEIERLPDNKRIMEARIIGTSLNANGRPFLPKEIEALLSPARPVTSK